MPGPIINSAPRRAPAERKPHWRPSVRSGDAVINTTVDGIIVINNKGTIEAFNRGAERLFGYSAAEAIGRNVNMLMPPRPITKSTTCILGGISIPASPASSAPAVT